MLPLERVRGRIGNVPGLVVPVVARWGQEANLRFLCLSVCFPAFPVEQVEEFGDEEGGDGCGENGRLAVVISTGNVP